MKKILLIDDHKEDLKLISVILKNKGYEVSTPTDPLEGLRLAADKKFDLIVLDIKMLTINGLEVLELLREAWETKGTTVLIVTGDKSEKSIKEAFNLGASEYLTKPFDPVILQNTVEKLLRQDSGQEIKPPMVVHDETSYAVANELTINPKAIEQLKVLGGKEFAADIINSFLSKFPIAISSVRQSLKNNEANQVEIVVHTLGSNSAQLGAVTLHNLCRKAEKLAEQKKMENIFILLDQLEEEFVKVATLLENIKKDIKKVRLDEKLS